MEKKIKINEKFKDTDPDPYQNETVPKDCNSEKNP